MTENIESTETSETVTTILFVTLSTVALLAAGYMAKRRITGRAKDLYDQMLLDNIANATNN